jgi:putative transposase
MALSEYQRSAGAVHSINWHIVWCPKYRRAVLVGPVADRLREVIMGKAAEHGWRIEALEIVPDHVHLFVRTDTNASASRVAHQLKGASSRALRQEFRHLRSQLPTLWSKSYFAATVGRVSDATIRSYIAEQPTRPTTGRP